MMYNTVKRSFLTLALTFFLLSPILMQSAEKPPESQLWTGAGIKYEISKKCDAMLDYELRSELEDDKDQTHVYETGIDYALPYNFSSGVILKLKDKPSGVTYELKPYASYKYEISDFSLKSRVMYEGEMSGDYSPEHYFRFRLGAEYDLTKQFSAEVKTEYFYHFCYDSGDRFDKNRSTMELTYKICKPLEVSAFWMYQNEFNEQKCKDKRVWGLHLTYKIK